MRVITSDLQNRIIQQDYIALLAILLSRVSKLLYSRLPSPPPFHRGPELALLQGRKDTSSSCDSRATVLAERSI